MSIDIDVLTNEAGTVTAIIIPDAGTAAYGDFMAMLGAARLYFLEHNINDTEDVTALIDYLIVAV